MKIYHFLLALTLGAMLAACQEKSSDDITVSTPGTYILNNGNWGANDSNIGIYVPSTKTYTPLAFYAANSQKLGDLGQDILALGSEIYIAVNGSQTIFVTDADLKLLHQINADIDGTRLSPKALATTAGKMYVTYYEGFVGEIAPSDHSVRLCSVGPNPEGLAAAGGNLYVANSGGMSYPAYNNTLSVIPLDEFTEASTIEVNVNPIKVEASSEGKYVYVTSFGNYADVPAKLQVVETATGKVTDLDYASVSGIAKGADNVLYILCGGYDENWNQLPGIVYKHDMASNKPLGSFVKDDVQLANAYSISAAMDGYIYIGCSDYKTTGDIYVFTSEGYLHDKFDSQGLNPLEAY